MDPSPFLPLGSWQGSAGSSSSSRVRLWDAPGSLPFAGEASWKIILLPATPGLAATQPSAHRAISISLPSSTAFALLPVTKTSLLLSSQVCLYCREGTHPGVSSSLLLQWTPELRVTQICAKDKPTTLPDEEEADEASSVLLNSSVSLLVSSLDMLMAVI